MSPVTTDGASDSPASALSEELLSRFPAGAPIFDEVRGWDAEPLPAWQKLLKSLDDEQPRELARRWRESQQLIRENGIVFGAYLGADRQTRPWKLDPIPLLIRNREWLQVEAGLQQRARLMELILADLFGPQRLVADGLLPADVLFRHPTPWRAMHGFKPRSGRFLDFYAADMARSPDGKWWVVSDRCEAPSGLGFALENRIVISRMFPREFRDCHVRRLAPFFQVMKETLQDHSPRTDEPRIAILTEGRSAASYFEDAYFARYLGYTLVESSDLAVRDQRLWLKTLGGLLPIDVLMRRSESTYCDPLELSGDSAADTDLFNVHEPVKPRGVAGLLQAARSGNVAICNSPGSGLVESPVMMAFVPRLCEALLGEPLKLPGVATWWCGQPAEQAYVLEHLDELVIVPAFRNRRHEQTIARRIAALPRNELIEHIRATPWNFAAQQRVQRSIIPTWSQQQFRSGHLALRSYVVSSKDDYRVLAGGLARTSEIQDSLHTSLLTGEGSKDAWILAEEPVTQLSLLSTTSQNVEIRRSGSDLPSRVAEDIFWLGRQLERTEFATRLLRSVAHRLTSETAYQHQPDLPALLKTMEASGQIPGSDGDGTIAESWPAIDLELPGLVTDTSNPDSLESLVRATLFTASRVRDRLSVDSWRILLNMEEQFAEFGGLYSGASNSDTQTNEGGQPGREQPGREQPDLTGLLNLTNQLIVDIAAFSGCITESATRTQAYRFLVIGRRIERALQIGQLIANCFTGSQNIPAELLEAVLEVLDSLMTYRSRYMSNLQLSAVFDLVLTDETNPRSLAFQLAELDALVPSLPSDELSPNRGQHERIAMAMIHEVRMADIGLISRGPDKEQEIALRKLLASVAVQLPSLSEAITQRYFAHAKATRQLSDVTNVLSTMDGAYRGD